MSQSLIAKYNIPGPRYTSYPTVPAWKNIPCETVWKQHVKQAFNNSNSTEGISLYLHLPYCESLCTYCGCNKRITKNHAVEKPYIQALLAEWKIYLNTFGARPVVREIHLGGGTPTFFSPQNLHWMMDEILKTITLHPESELSFEAHPNNTTFEHLETLRKLGFTRLSLGIQDFDPTVQEIINRIQPFQLVKQVTEQARELGYQSVNFDLIYGLPLQNLAGITKTISMVNTLRPDRIAFYSYAHVPWKSPGQRRYTEADLPDNDTKRELYEKGKALFEANGYVEIGMDHFALPHDELSIAQSEKRLHRNFMGYTCGQTQLLVGLGASSISDSWGCFIQNEKTIEDYMALVNAGQIPIVNGHVLSQSDQIIRQHVLNLMTNFETRWDKQELKHARLANLNEKLSEMIGDGLVELGVTSLKITEAGKPFVRNVCMTLDEHLENISTEKPVFSKTV
jgi:oxygen-independent coproporphyrinogen III oxidase